MSRKRRAAARVRPVRRATSDSVSSGSSAPKARMTARPALERLDEVLAASSGHSVLERLLGDRERRCWRRGRRRRPRCGSAPRGSPRRVRPLRSAARTCIGISFSARSAVRIASVMHERVLRSRPGARPRLAPGGAGDVLLERAAEVGGVVGRAVDVLVAEHLAADLHAGLVAGVVHQRPGARACSCVTASGRSTLIRCAPGSRISRRARGMRVRDHRRVLVGRRRRVLRARDRPASAP